MNIHDYISTQIEKQGRSKSWVAKESNINYKTFVDKLSRRTLGADELLRVTSVLNINLEYLKALLDMNTGEIFTYLEYFGFKRVGFSEWEGYLSIVEIDNLYTSGILNINSKTVKSKTITVLGQKINAPVLPTSKEFDHIIELIKENKLEEPIVLNIEAIPQNEVHYNDDTPYDEDDNTGVLKIKTLNLDLISGLPIIIAANRIYINNKYDDAVVKVKFTYYDSKYLKTEEEAIIKGADINE